MSKQWIVLCIQIVITLIQQQCLGESQPVSDPAREPFVWKADAETGYLVAQITNRAGDNYGFYWHCWNNTSDGRYLVYRNMTVPSPSTITYYRVDLETGEEKKIDSTGLANCAIIFGCNMYAVTRENTDAPFNRLSRYNLLTLKREDLTTTDNELLGSIAVNSNESTVVYDESAGKASQNIHVYDIIRHKDRVMMPGVSMLTHFMFSPVDPNSFTYCDPNQIIHKKGITAVGVGRIDTGQYGLVYGSVPNDPNLSSPLQVLHPFYAADGMLWTDAMRGWASNFHYYGLTVSNNPFGKITSYYRIPFDQSEFNGHTGPCRSLDWYGGDGCLEYHPMGERYMHLVHINRDTQTSDMYRLAKGIGTELAHGGYDEASDQILNTLDGLTWTSFNSYTGSEPNKHQNIFLVKIPNKYKAQLARNIVAGKGPGPWKHGNRILVDGQGQWHCAYGNKTSFGDSGIDQDGAMIRSTSGCTNFDMADLTGDDVEDRIAMKWNANDDGTWTVYVARTSYNGQFSDDAAYTMQSYTGVQRAHVPMFNDLNGDSYDDVVTVHTGPDNKSLVWQARLNADGRLPAGAPALVGSFGDSILDVYTFLADVNGDGYADRIVARKHDNGWQWLCDYSTAAGFGDGVVDTAFLGGDSLDMPMVNDINGDGYADIIIVRRLNGKLIWSASLSDKAGFGKSGIWNWTNSVYGADADKPLIGHLCNFTTVHKN